MSFYVADRFRENPLSLTGGGKDVEIFFKNKSSRIYTRVKSPYKFWLEAREENPNIKGYRVLGESKEE
jgi:hypothetical protein